MEHFEGVEGAGADVLVAKFLHDLVEDNARPLFVEEYIGRGIFKFYSGAPFP